MVEAMQECHVELDLETLAGNVRAVRACLPAPAQLIFVVKAHGYGHGLDGVVRTAFANGAGWFAVIHRHEALAVRRECPDAEVLLLGVAGPEDVEWLAQARITPVVVGAEHGRELSRAAAAAGRVLPFHWKVDTGMGRLGSPPDTAARDAALLAGLPGLRLTGVLSHFASTPATASDSATAQVEAFRNAAARAEAAAGRPLMKHLSSSRAFQYHPEWDFDAVRLGILLYGYGSRDPGMRVRTRPWLQWKARLAQVKTVPENTPVGYGSNYHTRGPTDLGVVGVGYSDGYLRALFREGHVLAGGRRRKLAGRVSMNWLSVDLGPDSGLKAGDEIVLIGRQGGQELWADELARWAGTIPYEILTAVNPRHPRRAAASPPRGNGRISDLVT